MINITSGRSECQPPKITRLKISELYARGEGVTGKVSLGYGGPTWPLNHARYN